ncbi:zinc-dependent protease [Streptococcus pneumoniae]|nr:zinc-dependent protease [Streptococcus pneumoniae]
MYAGINRENRNQARKMMNNQLLDLKKGYFTEFELNQTKEMIRWSLLLSQDNQSSLIERAYQNALFGKSSADFKSWIAKLEQIDKDAICRVANNVKLQAIYFMEGIE